MSLDCGRVYDKDNQEEQDEYEDDRSVARHDLSAKNLKLKGWKKTRNRRSPTWHQEYETFMTIVGAMDVESKFTNPIINYIMIKNGINAGLRNSRKGKRQ